ncbi:MAG: hypothetical protein Ct9H300mP30_1480 [Methanobacteriota archaeon]|nr:MAG: hypothetical protein Ct9H300mP30_1480 [Euryarchaeota archaeon]
MGVWLTERRSGAVEVRVPKRGEWPSFAQWPTRTPSAGRASPEEAFREPGAGCRGRCGRAARPDSLDHIVCFDMAQLQGDERVGASVVLRKAGPRRRSTGPIVSRVTARRPRMMSEVVERWLKHQDGWPDLLLLDGGETHLSSILGMLEGHGLAGRFPVAALAKREETLHRDGRAKGRRC